MIDLWREGVRRAWKESLEAAAATDARGEEFNDLAFSILAGSFVAATLSCPEGIVGVMAELREQGQGKHVKAIMTIADKLVKGINVERVSA